MRPSWDDYFVEMARSAARRSICWRSQVGAVVVAADHSVLAAGYNGAPSGLDRGADGSCADWCPRGNGESHKAGYGDCTAVHGELNALLRSDVVRRIGGTMYVTRVPCFTCAKSIAAGKLARVVCLADEGGLFHKPLEVASFLEACGVEVSVYG